MATGSAGTTLHTPHARNIDLTYLVMNNQIYGLTTGQVSPTSSYGMTTKSTPFGSVETPVNPITSAIMNGATFVARGYSGDIRQLTDLIKKGVEHKGFALIDVFSPCVTFNLDNTHQFFKERIVQAGRRGARSLRLEDGLREGIAVGRLDLHRPVSSRRSPFSLVEAEPVLSKEGPLATRPLGLSEEQADRIIQRMM